MQLPDTDRTIIAQATPPGTGALAVLRLTGPKAFEVAARFTNPPQRSPVHKLVRLLEIREGGKLVDRAVAVFFRGPSSYTGQDTVEITCHGSSYVIRKTINLAVRAGASPAEPGEFTLRAFINGKLDLAQAEAVNGLIASGTEAAHRAALAQVRGEMSARVNGLKASAIGLLAELEVRLDDTYEEASPLAAAAFLKKSAALQKEILSLAAGFEAGRGIREGIRVAITGAPNSGKSSLMNALLGYDRAIVSPRAGTTRDTLEAALEVHGFKVLFTDTAGLDLRGGKLEKEGMRRALKAIEEADIVLLLKDSSKPSSPSDDLAARRVKELAHSGARVINIRSKADLRPGKNDGGLRLSCRTGEGLDALRRELVRRQRTVFSDGAQSPVIFARHFAALKDAAEGLQGIKAAIQGKEPRYELAAEQLRYTLKALGLILGEAAPDEVLAGIFSTFCVGK